MVNKAFNYLIVEDNKLDQLTLLAKADTFPQLNCIGTCENAIDAIAIIKNKKPDIVFLDVDMPGMNGMELLRIVKDDIPIPIFVTSHMEYALESYDLMAFDFLLKPVKADRFKACIDRVFDYLDMKQKAIAYSVQFENETITIKEGYDQVKINVKEIDHLESMKDYTKIVTVNKKHLTLMPLSSFMKQLPESQFVQIHRSYAVNRSKVTRLQSNELFIGSKALPIGKTFRSEIAKWKL